MLRVQINHAPSRSIDACMRLLGSVATKMDANTLKRYRSCESSSERLLEGELRRVKSVREYEVCDVHSAISSDLCLRNRSRIR
jgi:hypothetical protein